MFTVSENQVRAAEKNSPIFPTGSPTSDARNEEVNAIEDLHHDVITMSLQLRNSVKLHCFNSIETTQSGSHVTGVETANQLPMEISRSRNLSHKHRQTSHHDSGQVVKLRQRNTLVLLTKKIIQTGLHTLWWFMKNNT